MCASTFLVFYFVLNCASSLSSFAAQTTPAASINKTFGLKIIDFFFSFSHIYAYSPLVHLPNTSNLSLKILLPSNYPSFREWRSWVPFIWENRKFWLENEMVNSRHSVWKPSENMGCDLRRCNFSTPLSQFS